MSRPLPGSDMGNTGRGRAAWHRSSWARAGSQGGNPKPPTVSHRLEKWSHLWVWLSLFWPVKLPTNPSIFRGIMGFAPGFRPNAISQPKHPQMAPDWIFWKQLAPGQHLESSWCYAFGKLCALGLKNLSNPVTTKTQSDLSVDKKLLPWNIIEEDHERPRSLWFMTLDHELAKAGTERQLCGSVADGH